MMTRDLLSRALLAFALMLAVGAAGCDLYNQSLPPKTDAGPDSGLDGGVDGMPDGNRDGDIDADVGPDADAG